MTYRKAYKELLVQNEKLLDLCKKLDNRVKELEGELETQKAVFEAQEKVLNMYQEENLRLKKAPLKSVNDLINAL